MAFDDGGLAAHARALIEANLYVTLGTSDSEGNPWTTPVYFASSDDGAFYWMSAVDSEHSRNIAARPRVSLVVFDSTVAPYHGRAVYAVGEARELPAEALDRALLSYPRRERQGASDVTREDVVAPSPYRLYEARPVQTWVLCPREPRRPCDLHGLSHDHRAQVFP